MDPDADTLIVQRSNGLDLPIIHQVLNTLCYDALASILDMKPEPMTAAQLQALSTEAREAYQARLARVESRVAAAHGRGEDRLRVRRGEDALRRELTVTESGWPSLAQVARDSW